LERDGAALEEFSDIAAAPIQRTTHESIGSLPLVESGDEEP